MEEGTGPLPSEPPPLPYSLRTRKKSIAIFWILFVIDTLGQPLVLYWTLWYLTDLSHNIGMSSADRVSVNHFLTSDEVFSILTAALGGISIAEYFYRLYHLFRKSSRARPLNARKSRVRL